MHALNLFHPQEKNFLLNFTHSLSETLQMRPKALSTIFVIIVEKGKAKAYNTYIASRATYHSCSGAFVSQTERVYSP